MPNIASILKLEIARVARREVRLETQTLKKAVATQRSEIAVLKRTVRDLQQAVRRTTRLATRPASSPAAAAPAPGVRFVAKGLVSTRQRLGLSAEDMGLLIGASGQSVHNWEKGDARPRAKHLPAIAALRSIGKKAAAAQLAQLKDAA
jgi:DNA-binding transcriptional regulator YiaG